VVNNQALSLSPLATGVTPSRPFANEILTGEKTAPRAGKAYTVQVRVFMSSANAQALQKQPRRAGIEAYLETRPAARPFQGQTRCGQSIGPREEIGHQRRIGQFPLKTG
jgi:cell division septation protein DedD